MLAAPEGEAFLVSDDPQLPPRDAMLALNRSATAARLMAGAIHEVNNALQVISGTVEILQGRTDLPEPVTRALDRLRKQGTRAGGALADVLVFTKGAVDESTRVDMRETVDYCVAVRRFAIQRAGLTVRWEPDVAGSYFVTGTRGLVQQAVLNLIINAEQALAFTRGSDRRDAHLDQRLDRGARIRRRRRRSGGAPRTSVRAVRDDPRPVAGRRPRAVGRARDRRDASRHRDDRRRRVRWSVRVEDSDGVE